MTARMMGQVWLRTYTIRAYTRRHGESNRDSMLLNKVWLLRMWVPTVKEHTRIIILDLDQARGSLCKFERILRVGDSASQTERSLVTAPPVRRSPSLRSTSSSPARPHRMAPTRDRAASRSVRSTSSSSGTDRSERATKQARASGAYVGGNAAQ